MPHKFKGLIKSCDTKRTFCFKTPNGRMSGGLYFTDS